MAAGRELHQSASWVARSTDAATQRLPQHLPPTKGAKGDEMRLMRRLAAAGTLLLGVMAAAPGWAQAPAGGAKKPNILII